MSLTPRNSTILKANSNDSTRPDFAASYTVTAYPPGAVVVSVSTITVTVDAGHGFVAGDKYLANPGTNDTFSGTDDVQSVTATTIVMGQDQSAILSAGDVLVNLGPDTGTSTPNYDGSPMALFSDSDGGTAISNARVTCDSESGYSFYHKGDGRFWELVRDGNGAVAEAIKGHSAVAGRFNVADFGAAVDNSTSDENRVQAANDVAGVNGETVWFPQGTCLIAVGTGITCSSNVTYAGEGTVKYGAGTATAALFTINAKSGITFDGLSIDGASSSQQFGNIDIDGASSDITVRGCNINTGYSAVWIKQGSTFRIVDNYMRNQSHPVYVGDNADPGGGDIEGVLIQGNDISTNIAGADAIKTVKTCHDISIVNNWLHDNTQDGVDLFASGDRVTITGNLIEGNTTAGIDIKSNESTAPKADWGNSRQCTISGNIIRSNTTAGIRMTRVDASDFPYLYSVVGNVIYDNATYGVEFSVPFVTITGNLIAGNCTSTASNYAGIYHGTISGGTGNPEGCTITSNIIINNGEATKTNAGINLAAGTGCIVSGNVIDYDSDAVIGDVQDTGINLNAGMTSAHILGNYFGAGLSNVIVDNGTTTVIRNNYGYVTENSGTGSITSGGTTDAITHGLSVTPTVDDISITLSENPTNDPGNIWVDTITSTQFTVNCRNDPGASNLDFGWRAAVL